MKQLVLHNLIRLQFHFMIKDDVHKRAQRFLLFDLMKSHNDRYQTEQAFLLSLKSLYQMRYDFKVSRSGDVFDYMLEVTCINPNQIQDANYEQALYQHLNETIFNRKMINETIFDQHKASILQVIREIKDQKELYAFDLFTQNMFKQEDYKIPLRGDENHVLDTTYQDVVGLLSLKSLFNAYFIYDGEISNDLLTMIQQHFKDDRPTMLSNHKPEFVFNDGIHTVVDHQTSQSIIYMLLPIDLTDYKNKIQSAILANAILGGNANSLLFLNIREKMGYCYYIQSHLYHNYHMILIEAHVKLNDHVPVIKEIKRILTSMEHYLSDEVIHTHKKIIKNELFMFKDSIHYQISQKSNQILKPWMHQSFEQRVQSLDDIKLEDIKSFMKLLKPHYTFVLTGEHHA